MCRMLGCLWASWVNLWVRRSKHSWVGLPVVSVTCLVRSMSLRYFPNPGCWSPSYSATLLFSSQLSTLDEVREKSASLAVSSQNDSHSWTAQEFQSPTWIPWLLQRHFCLRMDAKLLLRVKYDWGTSFLAILLLFTPSPQLALKHFHHPKWKSCTLWLSLFNAPFPYP